MAEGESEGPGGEPGGTACGSRLALAPAARIWWPGVTRDSDPGDHPLVVALEVEVGLAERDPMTRKRRQASLEAMDV
jgi:hypothetical protein